MKINKMGEKLNFSPYENYFFLSGWIANFGVVPLFFIAFFLVDPAALAFLCLLFSVTFVLDTIKHLLNNLKSILPIFYQMKNLVKAIVLIFTINSPIWASDFNQDLVLAKGEQTELSFPSIRKFSVGNKDIIGHKIIKNSARFLIKGKNVGFTDFVLWDSAGTKYMYKIFVISKNDKLKTIHTADALKYLNLDFKIQGENIFLEGEITEIDAYQMIQKITKQQNNLLTSKLKLSSSLKSKIIEEIYTHFIKEGIQEYSCKVQGIKITCVYDELTLPSPEVQKLLKSKFDLVLLSFKSNRHRKNYKMKLKMLQMERLDGEELSLGLYRLQSNVNDLFSKGLQDLISRNQILIEENHLNLSTLAEPESILMLNMENIIEIGQEIPFRADTQFAQNTQWKFAGIKIKLKLIQCGEFYCLDYETEFTTPRDGAISGSKNKSRLVVLKNKPIQFFQVTFKTLTNDSTGLPYLSSIPLLGNLFKSKSNHETFKTISGYVSLYEEDENGEL